jgi:hypothetical protein
MPEAALTVEECQKHATACREMARQETDPHARKTLEGLAASWEHLCGELRNMAQSNIGAAPIIKQ